MKESLTVECLLNSLIANCLLLFPIFNFSLDDGKRSTVATTKAGANVSD